VQARVHREAYQQHKYGKHASTMRAIGMAPIDPRKLLAGRKIGLFSADHGEEPLSTGPISTSLRNRFLSTPSKTLATAGHGVQVELIQERSSMLTTRIEPVIRLKQRTEN
jgi:hypothetical protein